VVSAVARRREEILPEEAGRAFAGRDVGPRSTTSGFEKAKRRDAIVERHRGTRRGCKISLSIV
jgi:hypothetical protein